MERHYEAIEWDLHHYWRIDLLDFFRGELPWSKLARFLAQLPLGSRYQAAVDADFDVAEHAYAEEKRAKADRPDIGEDELAELEERKGPEVSTSAGYDLQVQTLMTIADLIQQLQTTLIAVNLIEGTPPKPRFMPRPVTALEVVRARHSAEDEQDSVEDALGQLGF